MNKSQKHPISDWLDEYLYIANDPPIYTLNHRDLNTYYLNNDKNLLCNNKFKLDELKKLNKQINQCRREQTNNSHATNIDFGKYDELIENKSYDDLDYDKDLINDSNYIHVFKNNMIKDINNLGNSRFIQYINPDSRRYHVNMLFNKLIDHCYNNKLVGFRGELLINKKMRNSFVKFCYENSKK
jgi:hypothetical protein